MRSGSVQISQSKDHNVNAFTVSNWLSPGSPWGLIYKTNPDLLWLVFCQYTLQFWLSVKTVGHKIAQCSRWLAQPWQERVREIGPGCPSPSCLSCCSLAHWQSLSPDPDRKQNYSQLGFKFGRAEDLCSGSLFTNWLCDSHSIESFSKASVDILTAYIRSLWFRLFTIIKFPGTPGSITSGNSFESCFFCTEHPLDRSSEIELLIWITSSYSLLHLKSA